MISKKNFLVFTAALAYLLVFTAHVPITDPVEANYALTAKEMMESGDWLTPRIYGEYWFDKPVLTYWLIGVSYILFGTGEFAARFPSALFGAASVSLVYWFAWRLYGSLSVAVLSAMVLVTSLEYWILARMVITDTILFFFTSLTLASYYIGVRSGRQGWFILAYAAAGLAVLTKGPVGLVLPGLIILAYIIAARQWRLLKQLFLLRGLAVFFAVAAPWYYAMYAIHGMEFVNMFLGLHNYLRATVSEHPGDNVWYYYAVLYPVSLLPWSGVLLGGVFSRRLPRPVHSGYLASWILVLIGFYSLMATKYLTYVFPAVFPAAVLIGCYLHQLRLLPGRKRWLWLSGPAILLYILFGVATHWLPAGNWLAFYVCLAVVSGGVLWLQTRGKVRRLPEAVAIGTAVISLTMISSGLIPLADARSAKDAVAAVPPGVQLGVYGDYSTSSVFYTGIRAKWLVQEHPRDDGDVWSKKYRIPTERITDFMADTQSERQTYILVQHKNSQGFLQSELAGHFTKVREGKRYLLYRRN